MDVSPRSDAGRCERITKSVAIAFEYTRRTLASAAHDDCTARMTTQRPATRPASFEAYVERMAGFGTPQSLRTGLEFRARPSDVIIAPYGKSGTTWLQQVFHG